MALFMHILKDVLVSTRGWIQYGKHYISNVLHVELVLWQAINK
jgi:hypothetical protein